MKRNFDLPILNLDGKPVLSGVNVDTVLAAITEFLPSLTTDQQDAFSKILESKSLEPMTLRSTSIGAIMGNYDEDKNLSDEKRIARLELARKIFVGGLIEITPAERDEIKRLLPKKWAGVLVPVVAGELLEQDVPTNAATT